MSVQVKLPKFKYFLMVFLSATLLSTYVFLVSAAQDAPQGPPSGQWGRGGGQGMLRVSGTIESIQPNAIALKTDDGKTITVQITPETRFRKNREEAKISGFAKGDHIFVGAQPGTDPNTVIARFVGAGTGPGGGGPPSAAQMQQMGLGTKFIAGEVKGTEETKLTILRPDGQTQVIQADENTSFQNEKRESVTLADIKVGDHVIGRGEMKDGIFVPATLRVGMPHPQGAPPEPPTK